MSMNIFYLKKKNLRIVKNTKKIRTTKVKYYKNLINLGKNNIFFCGVLGII